MMPNTTAMTSPPMTPPAIAGAFDLREDTEGVGDAECEGGVGEGDAGEGDAGDGGGVATTSSGLKRT